MDGTQECMEMIANAGEAKTFALKALSLAGQNDFETAKEQLLKSEESLTAAHKAHTDLLFYDAQNQDLKVTLLMMHAGDHLNSAETIKTLVEELIQIYEKNHK